jgi:hypothetical protein
MTQQASNPPAGTGWHVTSQQEGTQPGPSGTYTKGVTVYFTLDSGEQGSVFVPQATYNADNVRAAVSAKAATMAEVGQLSG